MSRHGLIVTGARIVSLNRAKQVRNALGSWRRVLSVPKFFPVVYRSCRGLGWGLADSVGFACRVSWEVLFGGDRE